METPPLPWIACAMHFPSVRKCLEDIYKLMLCNIINSNIVLLSGGGSIASHLVENPQVLLLYVSYSVMHDDFL